MRIFIILFVLLIAEGLSYAQPFNQEFQSENGTPVLLGKINWEGLAQEHYPWFQENYDTYQPESALVDSLSRLLEKYTITAFMGTWCGDSKREVPRFYKLLEEAQFPLERLTMVAVNRGKEAYKQSPGGEHEGMDIFRVPTFVIYKNGKEVNRIIESPVVSLEDDLFQILQKEYTPNYQGVHQMIDLMKTKGLPHSEKGIKKLVSKLEPTIESWYELNTLSNLLFYKFQFEEAIAIGQLNLQLFPEEPGPIRSLASKYAEMKETDTARSLYKKALAIAPNDELAMKGLESLDKADN